MLCLTNTRYHQGQYFHRVFVIINSFETRADTLAGLMRVYAVRYFQNVTRYVDKLETSISLYGLRAGIQIRDSKYHLLLEFLTIQP